MKRGKRICETLKGIRREIAQANEIVSASCARAWRLARQSPLLDLAWHWAPCRRVT